MNNDDDSILEQLAALGVGEFSHYNGSLATHLKNTHALLTSWGAPSEICKAGLFHAIYGTAGYDEQVYDLTKRYDIQKLIGYDVEQLVYLYCACDRKLYYPRIGTKRQHMFVDRFTNTQYVITNSTLQKLCELIMANELEIANHNTATSKAFVERWGKALRELFERMQHLVSHQAFASYQAIL